MELRSRLLAYLQLFRLPNVFTAIADVMMGFLFVQTGFQPVVALSLLCLASCFLYTAGMVLNDVFDIEVDRVERPQRPLPSGRIDLAWASKLGVAMLGLGVLLAVFVGPLSGGIAGMLAVAIYVYDGMAKKTPIAPLVMGSCRMLNVLLGMSLTTSLWSMEYWLISGGLGLYVAGITWFARSEAKASDRRTLLFGATVMLLGIVMVAGVAWIIPDSLKLRSLGALPRQYVWPAFLALIVFSVGRRCLLAIRQPTPGNVQQAVKHAILSLVVLDAAVVLAFVGPTYAMLVVALLLPTVTLGKWVYST